MSSITKKALAQSLKKIMATKDVNKVTINDITEDCGVNRQTFYYHFADIYDLLEWIYKNEVIEKIEKIESGNLLENWQNGFLYVFEYILENKKFVHNTYNSVSRETLLKFIYKQTNNLITKVIEEKSKNISINESNKKFISNFYKYAFVGVVQDWIEKGMIEEPKNIVNKLSTMLDGEFERVIGKLSM